MMTAVTESDYVMYLSALNMRSVILVLRTYHFWQIIHCSLQTMTNKKAVLWRKKTAQCRCKIRFLSKLTPASRGSFCDSTASCSFKLIATVLTWKAIKLW